jgi:hypothetical protein
MTIQSSGVQRLGGVSAPSVLQAAHFHIDDLPLRMYQGSVLWNVAMGRLLHSCPAHLLCYCYRHRPDEFMAVKDVAQF